VPTSNFLTRTLGYFRDPDVAFVVAPQVYGNLHESNIAHGAAIQAYVFHGVIQRGANGLDAPLLIGTNHLYRPSALAQVGGYQDSIIEDHLTSMAVYASTNPATGRPWKGVYTPDIIAVGEGPTSFTDYFNQQKRWAYGIWEIAAKHSPRLLPKMRVRQRVSFSLLQLFYPSVAVSWLLSTVLTAAFLIGGTPTRLPVAQWLPLWAGSLAVTLGTFFWLRRFNLVKHERQEYGLVGLALLMACIPVYVAAACAYLTGRPLAYAVTAKGNLTSPDNLGTFRPHLPWVVAAVGAVGLGVVLGTPISTILWVGLTLAISITPIAIYMASRRDQRAQVLGDLLAAT
jgi:cellulose synthase/poly-beta-1,6-N-acetylglucosamine synthase-like glycosyltransferase